MPLLFSYNTFSSFGAGRCWLSTVAVIAGEAMAWSPVRDFRDGGLNEGAEPGDRLADDEMLHLIGAFVGIERLGVREEARNVVIDEDAVAAEQLSRPGNRLAHLGRGERLGNRRLLVGKLALVRELCCARHHALACNGVAQHLGKKVLNELERADRLSELQSLL